MASGRAPRRIVPRDRPPRVVTIDGPAGTGKSATARALAERLGLLYLDSGALYRAFAWAAMRDQILEKDEAAFATWLARVPVRVEASTGPFRVFVGDEDVAEPIRREDVGQAASRLAMRAPVRERVASLLREAGRARACVAEGRDMGSAVFPEARPKIYLTASLEARTARRASQLRARGEAIDEARIRKDLEDRDLRDESREVSPLRVPGGAVRIDSSEIDLEQQIALVAGFIRGHGHFPGSRLYQWTQRFLRLFFRGLCGVRVRGLERVPAGACVVACNHQAYSDPLLVGSLLPGTAAFMAKAELFRGPLGGLVRRYNAIPVRRGTADRQALRTAVASLRRGVPLVIFPEGTRIRGGALGVPHAGVAWLARRAEVPVLPARVSGGSLLRSALRVEPQQVSFGEPLAAPRGPGRASPDESLPGTDAAFALQVMEAIASLDAPPGGPLPS